MLRIVSDAVRQLEERPAMSDRDLLEIRVRLTRLASELAVARSERDLARISAEVSRVRASLDDLLLMLPAA